MFKILGLVVLFTVVQAIDEIGYTTYHSPSDYHAPVSYAAPLAKIATYATPVQTYASPVHSYASPVQTYTSPIHTYASPVQTYASPVQTYASPVQTYASPVHTYASPVQTYASPVHTYATPVQSYSAPIAKVASYAPQHDVYQETPAAYDFEYGVNDPHTGDIKSQQESRRGDVVHGSYSVVDPDGTKRTVEYTADSHNGFNAIVRKEPLDHPTVYSPQHSYSSPIAKVAAYATPVAKIAPPVAANYAHAPLAYTSSIAHTPVAYSAPIAKVAGISYSQPSLGYYH